MSRRQAASIADPALFFSRGPLSSIFPGAAPPFWHIRSGGVSLDLLPTALLESLPESWKQELRPGLVVKATAAAGSDVLEAAKGEVGGRRFS